MIITNEEALRQPCVDAKPEEVGPIIDQLERELKRSAELGVSGIGLSAPQIGIFKNICIARINDNADYSLNIDLVNCKIKKGFDKAIFENEGCLSFPGRFEKTWRFQEIHVVDNLVEPYSFIGTGLFAVVVQHEQDHLDSILLPDVAIKNEPIINKKKIRPNDPCPCNHVDSKTGRIKKYKKCHGR